MNSLGCEAQWAICAIWDILRLKVVVPKVKSQINGATNMF